MNRRQFLGGIAVLGGLASSALSTESSWDTDSQSFRVGLATVVPAQFRADDRSDVTAQLRGRLPSTIELSVHRADEESLLRGLAGQQYDVVELGAVAGTMAVETGLATPLVQPQLAGGWQYEGQLLVDDQRNQPTGPKVIFGDTPLSTSTHAALAALRDRTDTVPRVCWHRSPTKSPPHADSPVDIGVVSDEFRSPPEASVDCSYPIPVPALYMRRGISNVDEIREWWLSVRGGRTWFGNVCDTVDAQAFSNSI